MIKKIRKLIICFFAFILLLSGDAIFNTSIITNSVEAHSGRTDSSGGHKDNKNKSGLGSYHYHCGGYPAHLHKNRVCPYKKTSTTKSVSSTTNKATSSSATSNNSESSKLSKEEIKKVQKKLNELGYNCGTADGILGNKTKIALKQYQEDCGLKVDGIIGKEVLKSLDI